MGFVESIYFEFVYLEALNKVHKTINFASRLGRAAKTTAALSGSRKANAGRSTPTRRIKRRDQKEATIPMLGAAKN